MTGVLEICCVKTSHFSEQLGLAMLMEDKLRKDLCMKRDYSEDD